MSTPAPYFFMSYSREDVNLQKTVIAGLRQRGVNAWVDVENLIPGSPAWEREIERAIRGASGLIVLLSPDANNSEWVRREISFAEQHEKRIFPVLIHGDEDDSIPLRLSNHQRVDLRRNFGNGLDSLADALNEHLGVTAVQRRPKENKTASFDPGSLQRFILPGVLALVGLVCLGGLTFAASYIYSSLSQPTRVVTTPPDIDPTIAATPGTTPGITLTAIETANQTNEPTGKIVYTCQIAGDEICIINADASGWQRLTDLTSGSFYASLAPDGKSVLYVNSETGKTEIYELDLESNDTRQLTKLKSDVGSPEISPDNKFILFTRKVSGNSQVWIMNRDGSDPHELYSSSGKDAHDATWSTDGSQILFALGRGENNKLYIMDFNGRDPRLVNDTVDTRGRSDWSSGNLVVFDMGGPFKHDVHIMNTDGSNLHQVSDGNNSQGASFSPDGQWITLTAYTNVANRDEASCEIYIMRLDGSDRRRLTSNNYCDYQPRWGP
jgi:Tol biopolymer transport system component